jgi:microcystin-dependent protein
MANPFIGEIRMFAGNFAPMGWVFCDGSLLPISQFDTLYSLLGTTYGGDGQQTFGVPDLRGRIPLHVGSGFALGQTGGAEAVTLASSQIPGHTHPLQASTQLGAKSKPDGTSVLAQTPAAGLKLYTEDVPGLSLNASSLGPVGGAQPHDNMAPFLAVSFIICWSGIFPTQS